MFFPHGGLYVTVLARMSPRRDKKFTGLAQYLVLYMYGKYYQVVQNDLDDLDRDLSDQ